MVDLLIHSYYDYFDIRERERENVSLWEKMILTCQNRLPCIALLRFYKINRYVRVSINRRAYQGLLRSRRRHALPHL